ncbi:MAG TPA: HAD-IC family P-type ATPase, partial [Gemmatimonadales bacterium]|nr:HAD-IC family P-type ATPase [Gemmatimonadales bacterium]
MRPRITPPPAGGPSPAWHELTPAEVARRLGTSLAAGLGTAEAQRRLELAGPNQIDDGRRQPAIVIFLRQFTDIMVLVLAAAAVLAGVIGEPQDTIAIVAILLLNALLGFFQEYRAERAVAALRAMASAPIGVRRDGHVLRVPVAQLVPGDLVLLEAGNLVPADLRLVECHQLRIDESLLTGESFPVEKEAMVLNAGELLVDRRNSAWRGTVVTHGHGSGVVVATGMDTELGRIAGLLSVAAPPATPLQQRLVRLGQRLAAGALAICGLVLLIGIVKQEPFLPMLLTAVSLAVAAIPESLPAVVTVALALGARRMARQQALVRRLPAVETLGSVTCICADKTGTLTLNRMRVESWWLPGESPGNLADTPARSRLLQALSLCQDVQVAAEGTLVGEPTEVALVEAVLAEGVDPAEVRRRLPRSAEVPFTAERAFMSTMHRENRHTLVVTKGSPERIVEASDRMLGRDGPIPVDAAAVLALSNRMAADGLRVLAVAERHLDGPPDPAAAGLESGLTLLGLVGLMDPPRPEAAAAVATCREAGIAVVMITGDHPGTARSIAARVGIPAGDGEVLTGPELARLHPAQLA